MNLPSAILSLRRLLRCGCSWAPWICTATLAASSFVYESRREFSGTGDFNGDGLEDALVVDKQSGVYRIGYGTAGGSFDWADGRPSGVERVTSVSLGKLLFSTRDALLVTAPAANRVNVLDPSDPTGAVTPQAVFPASVGPSQVVPLNIGGSGDVPALDDLAIGTVWNNAPDEGHLGLVRSTGTSFPVISDSASAGPLFHANPIHLKAGGPWLLGSMVSVGLTEECHVYDLTSGSVSIPLKGTVPLNNARFVYGAFGGQPLSTFLFYTAGSSNLVARPILEPLAGVFKFGADLSLDLDLPIQQVFVLAGAKPRLLMLLGDGSTLRIYNYDGGSVLKVVSSVSTIDDPFTGAVPTSGGGFLALSGSGGISSNFQRYAVSGDTYTLAESGALPDVNRSFAAANVFLFQKEPFVSLAPVLLGSYNAPDWTTKLSLAGSPPSMTVSAESFVDASHGLDTPSATSLGTGPASAQFGLVNQISPVFSLRSSIPAVGAEVIEVSIAPTPGPQKNAIQVTLTPSTGLCHISYRVGSSGSWIPYKGAFPLFKTTTLQYFAQPLVGNAKSVIHTATYTFPIPPAQQDSDQDGVPDFVELGYDGNNDGTPDYLGLGQELNPVTSGKDSDGDGFSDLNEMLVGTNPYDASSKPTEAQRMEEKGGFDLYLTPRPLDGTVPTTTLSAMGVGVRAHTLQGNLAQFTETTNVVKPGLVNPTAHFTNIILDVRRRLMVVATDPHFAISTASPDPLIGRELVRLLPVPSVQLDVTVPYTFTTASLSAQAKAWILAAQAAYAPTVSEEILGEITVPDVLTTLLVERKIGDLLHSRGLPETNQVSILGFRPNDLSRYRPSQSELLSLEQQIDDAHPGFSLVAIYTNIHSAVASAPTLELQKLNAVATDIYRISSALNNATPGRYPSPLDTLRDFLTTGTLQSNYLAAATLAPADLASGLSGVAQVLNGVPPRPVVTVQLQVRADSFTSACTRLDLLGGSIQKNLVFADGSPYRFPEAFTLLAGSLVQVTGYSDVASTACPGDTLEVISASLTAVPAPSSTDSDGNLLADAWELVFFGKLGVDPYDDPDHDGVSNLQEFLDGTDPNDQPSHGGTAISLLPPVLVIAESAGSQFKVKWSFPAGYSGKFKFGVMASTDLNLGFTDAGLIPVPLPGGEFEVTLPPSATGQKFYKVYLTLP